MQLRDFKIGTRLIIGFGSILLILVAMVVMTNVLDMRDKSWLLGLGVAGVVLGAVLREVC